MSINYSVTWNASISGISGGGVGVFLVSSGATYLAATSANIATYPLIRAVVISAITNGIAQVQHAGDVPASITGITGYGALADGDYGYAVLNEATGTATFTTSPTPAQKILGRVDKSGTLALSILSNVNNALTELDAGDYGATGDGTTDDTAALQAAIDAMDAGDTLLIRPGNYKITAPLNVYQTTAAGQKMRICITGTSGGYDVDPSAMANIIWAGTEKSGSAASITADVAATGAHPQGWWPTYYWVTVTGLSGITSADLGKRIKLSGTSGGSSDGHFPIVKINSSTSVDVMFVANPTTPDANNGSITWRVLETMLHWHTRESRLMNLAFSNSTSVWSAIDINRANGDGSIQCTHNFFERIYITGAGGATPMQLGVELGGMYVPVSGDLYYATADGRPIPYAAYQLDYQEFHHLQTYNLGTAGLYCTNGARQSRANILENCGFVTMPYGILCDSWHTSSNNVPASFQFNASNISFGNISETCIKAPLTENAQPMVITGMAVESVGRFLDLNWADGSVGQYPVVVNGGYFATSNAYIKADGKVINIRNGPAVFNGCTFNYTDSSGGVKPWQVWLTGDHAYATFVGCQFPDPAWTGQATFATNAKCRVHEIGCSQFNAGAGTQSHRDDRVWSFFTDAAKLNLNTVGGLSGTQTASNNFSKVVTVADAATSGTWTFATNEADTSYDVSVTPCGRSGAPAAGSNRVTGQVTKNVGSFVFNVEAAPTAGNSVSFLCILTRAA